MEPDKNSSPSPAQVEVTDEMVWPAGCRKPNSCSRHRQCMYVPCAHEGSDIAADIDAALTATDAKPVVPAEPSKDELIVSLLRQLYEARKCTLCGASKWCEACEEVASLAPSPAVVPAEPVAWLAEGYGYQRVFIEREAAEKLAQGGTLTALYAAPPSPVEGEVERLRKAGEAFADQVEVLLSADPEMPTAQQDYDDTETALTTFRAALASEGKTDV